MKPQVLSPHPLHLADRRHWTGARLYQFVVDRFLLLPIGALVAIAWANVAPDSYYRFARALAFPVNQIGMALFLALIAQDVLEAVMPGGRLHSWRRWSVPLIAAAGGVAGSAAAYLAWVSVAHEAVLVIAWPVACAIDIAAGYYVLKTIARRSGMLAFLVLLAAATDLFVLLVAAVWPPFAEQRLSGLPLLALAVGLAAWFHRQGRRDFWPYLLICGPLAWAGLYLTGIHPALALIPLVPFLPRQPRHADVFAGPEADGDVRESEHAWHEAVQVVLFFFGLVNAGVMLRGFDTGSWAVVVAAVVGRPVGILLATALAVAIGLHLPRGVGWREVVVVALATTSGFTFALFLSVQLLPVGAVLSQIKFGALLTTVGAVVTIAVAALLRAGRQRPARA